MTDSRVEQLWEKSGEVLADCALPNGAIVAANSDLAEYPASAVNYRYVWGRDNAFQIYAAHLLGDPMAPDRRDAYLNWLNEQAEGFSETGLIIKRYATSGDLDRRYGTEYQPDQAGALLWAVADTQEYPDKLAEKTTRQMANGLCARWGRTNFITPTQDLWENRTTSPEAGDVFTYSIVAVAHGLDRAVSLLRGKTGEVDRWEQARDEMRSVLAADQVGEHFRRKIYAKPSNDPDNTLDASLDGLIFPFSHIGPEGYLRRRKTVSEIGRTLCHPPDGVLRYKGDTYDGIARPGGQEATAGRWPLLTFWHVVALNKTGQAEAAKELYETTVAHLDVLYKDGVLPDNLIPEQLFSDEREGKAVLPLAWSHAMFVIATKELKLI